MSPSHSFSDSEDEVPKPVEKTPAQLAYEKEMAELEAEKQRVAERQRKTMELLTAAENERAQKAEEERVQREERRQARRLRKEEEKKKKEQEERKWREEMEKGKGPGGSSQSLKTAPPTEMGKR